MASLSIFQKIAFWALLMTGLQICSSVSVFAVDESNQRTHGVAIKGYDPVAYFTENKAVKGTSDYSYEWNEASWYFSNPEHRELFAANPEKYAPKHSGF